MAIEPINEANFDEKVNQATQPLVVDFWLANCPPCQTLEPRLEAMAQKFAGQVNVYRLDVEKSPSIPEQYGVMSVPTLIFFEEGEPVKRLDGLITQKDLGAAFREVIVS
jgi:thioredoxin 1